MRHLRALVRILGQMRSEISYGKHTMPEICLLLSELNDEYYSIYFGRIYERTAGESGTGFPKVWEEELEKCLGPLPLREDERKAMSELAKTSVSGRRMDRRGVLDRWKFFWREDSGRQRKL